MLGRISARPSPRTQERPGFIAMLTVVIIGALVLTLGIAAALQGQTETLMAGQADYEQYVRSVAQTCIDEALHRLKLDSGYAGGTVPIGADTCTVTVSGGGSSRTIVSTATSDVFTKVITVAASLKQNVPANARAWHVDAWTESDPP
ncbi:hypothetical protein HY633_05170 [Candidatus Uhrbacteria bacterium]|nr:hypothetical protein [Candidatus Uhrbacteria bacterium]